MCVCVCVCVCVCTSPHEVCSLGGKFCFVYSWSRKKCMWTAIIFAYFCDLLTVYTPSRQIRSSVDTQIFRIPHVKTKTLWPTLFFLQCSKAMAFAPFRDQSHSVLSRLQNCVKNSPIQIKLHLIGETGTSQMEVGETGTGQMEVGETGTGQMEVGETGIDQTRVGETGISQI